jgi:hypothetical protein
MVAPYVETILEEIEESRNRRNVGEPPTTVA